MTQNKLANNVFYTECVKACLDDCYNAALQACKGFTSINIMCWIIGRMSCDTFIKGGFGKRVPSSSYNDLPPG